jgi:hypothetical protein
LIVGPSIRQARELRNAAAGYAAHRLVGRGKSVRAIYNDG